MVSQQKCKNSTLASAMLVEMQTSRPDARGTRARRRDLIPQVEVRGNQIVCGETVRCVFTHTMEHRQPMRPPGWRRVANWGLPRRCDATTGK